MNSLKKFIIISAIFGLFSAFADEQVLLKYDAKADVEGYDYVSNFEIVSDSGYFTKDTLKILEPNEKGFRFLASNVPERVSTSYKILPSYPSFLNEPNTSAGYIDNASYIKAIKVVGSTNRPYDEIFVMYSTSPKGEIKYIKMPQDFNKIKSMEEFELVFENPTYTDDVSKRELASKPVLGEVPNGIYFRGIKIQTNSPNPGNSYSSYSVLYIKEISFIYDNAYSDEQLKARKELMEEFKIDEDSTFREKIVSEIKRKSELKEAEKELMHKE